MSVGNYLERFKRYVIRSRLYAGKIFKGLDITVTVEVDSTEKNCWVTIIVQARSACIITNVSV